MGNDQINHPDHYSHAHPGLECIDLADSLSFSLGNAVKYVWRYQMKNHPVEDLRKADWYVAHAIERQETVALSWSQTLMLRELEEQADGYEQDFWMAFSKGDLAQCRKSLAGMIRHCANE